MTLLGDTPRTFAGQGETVKVEGGNLTVLRWCAFVECPQSGHGNVWVWVKACATENGWNIDEADFDVLGARLEDVDSVVTPPPAALGRRTLDVGTCVERIAAYSVAERPTHVFYEGHGHRVTWELQGGDRIPLTEATLGRFPADQRGWLVQFETFYRRARQARLREENTPVVTARRIRSWVSLGEACDGALSAGDPGRFVHASKTLEDACTHLRTAAEHFTAALAAAPDATPLADTPEAREFGQAFDDGLDQLLAGHDALDRAHDRALDSLSKLPPGSPRRTSEGPGRRAPHASTIAFVSRRDSNDDIYVMNADGSGVRRLTRSPDNDGVPAWSPDGTRIAFGSDRDGNAEIYVMNADGSEQRRLTRSSGADAEPAWSPDGTTIAFTSDRYTDFEIYTLNADGLRRRLTHSPGLDYSPTWSPDGTRIAFTSDRDGNEEIYVMKADGGGQRRLTRSPAADASPAWSPDGTRIAFTSDRDANAEVYVMNADGSGLRNLTRSPATDVFPSWSPDGRRIVFQSRPDGNRDIYVMNADGSGMRRLTAHAGHDVEPAWQPAPSRRP